MKLGLDTHFCTKAILSAERRKKLYILFHLTRIKKNNDINLKLTGLFKFSNGNLLPGEVED